MRKHGIDFGRWRQWAEPDNPPKPLDFVIAGVTSGNHKNQMWEANRLALADYRENGGVLGLYHFYEPVNALSQIKVFIECVAEVKPQFVAIDYEELTKTSPRLGATDAAVTKDIIRALWQYFDHDKVMVYCGHDTWATQLRNYDPDFYDTVELWLAWPNLAGEDTYQFHPLYKDKMGRNFEDVRIFQYDWYGKPAIEYGILNASTVDLNVYVNKQPFSEWIGQEPETPEQPGEGEDMTGIIEQMQADIAALKDAQIEENALLAQILAELHNATPVEPPVEPPTEPPAGETSAEIAQWQTKPQDEWPLVVGNNLQVAYVTPTQDKLPLWDGEDSQYEDVNLRPWSNPDNLDSIRINVKKGEAVMVYAAGPAYAGVPDKDVRPYQMGGFYGYLVMHEQRLDGINLWEKLPTDARVFLPVSKVEIIKK